jgi:hypothetical protein
MGLTGNAALACVQIIGMSGFAGPEGAQRLVQLTGALFGE